MQLLSAVKTFAIYISSLDYIRVSGKQNPRLLMSVYKKNQPNRYSDDYGRTFNICNFKVSETYGLFSEYSGYFTLPFCIDPNDNNIVFTSLITPYKSTDGGATFEFSGSGYSGFMVNDMYFDDNGAVKYMAVTDVGFARMKPEEGTIYSSSYGISDIEVPSYVEAKSSTSLAVDPNNENHGFAAMGGYMYGTPMTLLETTDGFRSLNPISGFEQLNAQSPKTVSLVRYHPQSGNVIYTDYYASENNGASWREVLHPIKGISPFDGDTLYSLDNYKIYISRDRGISWTDTGLTVASGGKYEAFCVDSFYEDVIWTAENSLVYRIDIVNHRIDTYDGGETKFLGYSGGRLEFLSIIQNPKLKNHLIISGRDLTYSGSYVYETFDYGETWEKLECFPHLAYEDPIAFDPEENVVFFSGMMGTLAYKWDKSGWNLNKGIIQSKYNEMTGIYRLSGTAGSEYAESPVTLKITDENEAASVYAVMTDESGNFEFTVTNIEPNTGDYDITVGLIDNESFVSDTFSSGGRILNGISFSAIYNPESKNFVIYGNSVSKNTVTFTVKERGYSVSGTVSGSIFDAVKHVAEIKPDINGRFVYKFRFEPPPGRDLGDYTVNLLNDSFIYRDIPIKVVNKREYNYEIAEAAEIDFTEGEQFTVNVKWRYFLENELNTQLYAALYDSAGKLIKVLAGQKTMLYNASDDSITGEMPENCSEIRVFLWSDMRPLGNVVSYSLQYGEVNDD